MLNDFNPENALETAIVEARQGSRTMTSLLSALSGSDVYISSKTEVLVDGSGFEPLLLARTG